MRILHVPYVRKVYICENAETSSDLCENIIQDAEMSFSAVNLLRYHISAVWIKPGMNFNVPRMRFVTGEGQRVVIGVGCGALTSGQVTRPRLNAAVVKRVTNWTNCSKNRTTSDVYCGLRSEK